MIFMMILACVVIGTTGQLLLKYGMDKVGEFAFAVHNIGPIFLKVATNPFIIGGVYCYVLSLAIWLMVLSRAQVSYAYPMLSLGYVVTAIAAYYFFGEDLSLSRIVGIVFVILGVLLIAR
jgi:multidrug transporter EmrE-like cation transporter